jgi:hypothetical protein
VHGLGADANLYAYVHGAVLKATDPLGLAEGANRSFEPNQNTMAGGVADEIGKEAKPQTAAVPVVEAPKGRVIHPPAPIIPSLPRVPQGPLADARDQAYRMAEQKKGLESAVGYGVFGFMFVVALVEEIPRAVPNFPSNGELAGQHMARAAEPGLTGAERLEEGLQAVVSETEAVQGALPVAVGAARLASVSSTEVRALTSAVTEPKCFAEGTLVATETGDRPIESVRVGDRVLSRDASTGVLSLERVVRLKPPSDAPIVELVVRLADETVETLRTTVDHPFWRIGSGWTLARDLVPGDPLTDSSRNSLRVESVRSSAALERVFNFEVEGTHSYFVSKGRVWVHNADSCIPKGSGAATNVEKSAPSRGYDRPEIETKSGVAVKEPVKRWNEFLGPNQTNVDPRDGLSDPDRIWSSDGTRSVRFGAHEMNSSPSKVHYHEETWHADRVENVLQRVPQKPK